MVSASRIIAALYYLGFSALFFWMSFGRSGAELFETNFGPVFLIVEFVSVVSSVALIASSTAKELKINGMLVRAPSPILRYLLVATVAIVSSVFVLLASFLSNNFLLLPYFWVSSAIKLVGFRKAGSEEKGKIFAKSLFTMAAFVLCLGSVPSIAQTSWSIQIAQHKPWEQLSNATGQPTNPLALSFAFYFFLLFFLEIFFEKIVEIIFAKRRQKNSKH